MSSPRIENIFRRLKENHHKLAPDHTLKVVFLASCEVRNRIVAKRVELLLMEITFT